MNKAHVAFIFTAILTLGGAFYCILLPDIDYKTRKSLETEYIINNGLNVVEGSVLTSPHITFTVNNIQELCAIAHDVNSTIIYYVRSSIEPYYWGVFNEDYSIRWKLKIGRK